MVLKLEVCSTCKTLLDIYTERRKREKEDIYRVSACESIRTCIYSNI